MQNTNQNIDLKKENFRKCKRVKLFGEFFEFKICFTTEVLLKYSTLPYLFVNAFTRNEVRIVQYLWNPVEVPVVVLCGCCGEHSLAVPVPHLPQSRWRRS
jgi:hypothetical protein